MLLQLLFCFLLPPSHLMPFSFLTNKLKITSVTSDAVVHAFATFILLSASSLTFNMINVFCVNPVYRSTNGTIYQDVLYYDPTITAFSHEHILYGVLAVVPFIVSVLIYCSSTDPITTTLCVPYKDLWVSITSC